MKILLTGSTGFIGRHLLQSIQNTHTVFALKLENEPVPDVDGVTWISQDLNIPLHESGLPSKIDVVIHLAQSIHYRQFPEKACDIYHVNIQSTFHLLEYARKASASRFIYASSGSIYAPCFGEILESSRAQPGNFYATSKFVSELMIENYDKFFIPIIFRLFFVYGPGQKGMLIPGLIEKVLKGERISIDGEPGITITPSYVEDVVSAFMSALNLHEKNIFNIAGDEKINMSELVSLIGQIAEKEVFIDYKMSQVSSNYVANNRKMKEVLGIFPKICLKDGLCRTVASMSY